MRTWFLGGLAALLLAAAVIQNAAGAEGPTSVDAGIEKILKNQEKILVSIEEIKKELAIIKIRATQK